MVSSAWCCAVITPLVSTSLSNNRFQVPVRPVLGVLAEPHTALPLPVSYWPLPPLVVINGVLASPSAYSDSSSRLIAYLHRFISKMPRAALRVEGAVGCVTIE
ncbi:hypothetical protein PST407_00347 [Pseudomonas syringae pv. tomato]|uniref:Uncharacterized protein n=1 Tax=Pseudomonas avellanae TaxID=46257 RepID=A0A3M5SRN8_9PSED|nr:hypothetical protein PST407_00347 [Pseudomonas syringae pv. tomato]RMU23903.1 hypothetical protein ALP32_200203 [Pseudomonas avellanae]